MVSRKPSAKAKRISEFKAQLGGLDDAFARENARSEHAAEQREATRRAKACESKNRYSSPSEAQEVIRACAAHGRKGLKAYRCPYCNGWHLTSHPWDE